MTDGIGEVLIPYGIQEIVDAIYWGKRANFVTATGILVLTSTDENHDLYSFQAMWRNGKDEDLVKVSKHGVPRHDMYSRTRELAKVQLLLVTGLKEVWDWRERMYPND